MTRFNTTSLLDTFPLTILLMSVAKVTPLFGLSWEPLLLPPREFLLMIPGRTNTRSHIKFNSGKRVKSDRKSRQEVWVFLLTLDGQDVQPLQAVPAGRGEGAPLGQAPLSAGQHSSRRHDPCRGNLPHLLIQLLDLSLLSGLQGLHLRQMSVRRQTETRVRG